MDSSRVGHCRVTALPRLNSCSASNSPAARPVILCLGRFKIRLEQIWAIMLHKLMHMEQARACGDRLNRHRLVPQRKIHTPRPNSPMANYVAITARPFLHRCAIYLSCPHTSIPTCCVGWLYNSEARVQHGYTKRAERRVWKVGKIPAIFNREAGIRLDARQCSIP